MFSRVFVYLEVLSFQVLESPVELLLSHGQAVVGAGSALVLCRVCSAGAKQHLHWVAAGPASLKAEKPALVPALPGQAQPLFWAPVHLQCSLPAPAAPCWEQECGECSRTAAPVLSSCTPWAVPLLLKRLFWYLFLN